MMMEIKDLETVVVRSAELKEDGNVEMEIQMILMCVLLFVVIGLYLMMNFAMMEIQLAVMDVIQCVF